MKMIWLLLFFSCVAAGTVKDDTKVPIVGVLTLHISKNKHYPRHSTYLYTSYGKWLEESGIRWIPILLYDSQRTIRKKLDMVNGVLLTGGSEPLGTEKRPSRYSRVLKTIVKYAEDKNDEGVNYPIFGICMGFEGLLSTLTCHKAHLKDIDNDNKSLGIHFTDECKDSLFNTTFSMDDLQDIKDKNLFYFHHHHGYLMDDLNEIPYVRDNIKILGTNGDSAKGDILTIFQHRYYPFFATQFHPEKIQFEYFDDAEINNSDLAIQTARKMSKLFKNMLGQCKAHISNKRVLRFREGVELAVEYNKADEAYIFKPRKRRRKRHRIVYKQRESFSSEDWGSETDSSQSDAQDE